MSYISRNDIEVKVQIINSGNLVARATVILFDVWEEHGWRIMKSIKTHPTFGEEIWIQAPCFKTTNKKGEKVWKEITYISNKPTWELVHEMIYDAYHMARSKKEGLDGVESKENSENEKSQIVQNQSEEVNPDDIPF